ncbi:MAG: hypothetical protein FWD14_04195 [Treponema sp.]|nr:hypothetical protein [Treponema sp.]
MLKSNMNFFYKIPGLFIILICVFCLSCGKNASLPKGFPIITEQPKSATYLDDDTLEQLRINVSVKEGFNLSYQWYALDNFYWENVIYKESVEKQVLSEIEKLINSDLGESLFEEIRAATNQNFNIQSNRSAVYVCVVTSTSADGSKTFKAVSDHAVITIIRHPLRSWSTADINQFSYRVFVGDPIRFMRLNDITFGNGYFVIVGDRQRWFSNSHPVGSFGRILYSIDGKVWNIIEDNPFNIYGNTINAVAYGGGRFVAVGTNGIIAYSTDVKTWIPADNEFTGSFREIIYGNNYFITSNGRELIYSSNGESWSIIENFSSSQIYYIAYVNNHFFACNVEGEIFISDDGKTWRVIQRTVQNEIFDSHSIINISYGNGRYLAVAYKYGEFWDPDSYKMAYSNDCETWFNVTPSRYEREWSWIRKIIFNEGYFVAIGADKTAFSKDGINWNNLGESYWLASRPEDRFNFNAITYGNGHFVAMSNYFGVIKYSQWPITKEEVPVITETLEETTFNEHDK